jgi:hypothetical protein
LGKTNPPKLAHQKPLDRRSLVNGQSKDNSGTLWPNPKKKEGDKRPDWTGAVTVNGRNLRVAAWWHESRKQGGDYLSLSFTEPQEKQAEPAPTA